MENIYSTLWQIYSGQ